MSPPLDVRYPASMPPTVWQSRTTGLQYPVTPDSEIPDDDFGTPSTRPAITTKPSTSDTGPRYAPVMSLTGTAALASVLAAPVEADGKRYLRKASITGGITFDAASHTNIVFEDCVLDRGMGTYGVRAFWGTFTLPSSNWPEFRYCKIMNASSASIIGQAVRFLRCHITRGTDLAKLSGSVGGELYGCLMNDTWHGDGAHCDVIQIVSGAAGWTIHYNNLDGFNAADSPSAGGQPCSGVLQTGTVTNDIGPVTWNKNWLDGGGYTIRVGGGSDNPSGYAIEYTFTNNLFGRGSRYGPTYGIFGAGITWDNTNVFEDNSQPVR